jgi:hypothetical protein
MSRSHASRHRYTVVVPFKSKFRFDLSNVLLSDHHLKAAVDVGVPSAIQRPQTDLRSGCGMLV